MVKQRNKQRKELRGTIGTTTTRALNIQARLYYCHRDDVVFDPEHPTRAIKPEQRLSLLLE